jgi:hypothetical protein
MLTGMSCCTSCLTTHKHALARYSTLGARFSDRNLAVQDRFVAALDRMDTHKI